MRLALATVVAILGMAAPAAAGSTVTLVDGQWLTVKGGYDFNAVVLSAGEDGGLLVYDGAGIETVSGCEKVTDTRAACPAGVTTVRVELEGGGPQSLAVAAGVTTTVHAFGGVDNDTIYGGAGNDQLHGEGGNDIVAGGGGADHLYGGAGADLLAGDVLSWVIDDGSTGPPGQDRLEGDTGDDLLDGGPDSDTIVGAAGFDTVSYAGRTAPVRASLGARLGGEEGERDTLDAVEALAGGSGPDVLEGSVERDALLGGPGNDRLAGDVGDDALSGQAGDDVLLGDARADDDPGAGPLTTGGNDQLDGGDGQDQLRGDGGKDKLTGGAGADSIDAREAFATTDPAEGEHPDCGTDSDSALVDWFDGAIDCESVVSGPHPPVVLPAPGPPPPAPGPGPQPPLGTPVPQNGGVSVPVHCPSGGPCAVRLELREAVRAKRRRRGGRPRAWRVGRRLGVARTTIAGGGDARVFVSTRRRVRRAALVLVVRAPGKRESRWSRPVRLR